MNFITCGIYLSTWVLTLAEVSLPPCFQVFHEDLEAKRKAVNTTIDKCNKMLRETTNEEADDIKNKLDTIRNQADLVCKLSSERLAVLEEALPLASHFR